MDLSELLDLVRATYVKTLAEAVGKVPSHKEPALRNADGELAVSGSPPLPCRVDLIPKTGADAGTSLMVNAVARVQFEPASFRVGETLISLVPFGWDDVQLHVCGLPASVAERTLVDWFMRWFDVDDDNAEDADGLYGVVHFMSDLTNTASDTRTSVDLGSVPVRCVEELMICLSEAGARKIHIG